ncbi:MAG: hypothetical protein R3Y50_00355 [Rikenellaceae bacterium]
MTQKEKQKHFNSIVLGDNFDIPFVNSILEENRWFSLAAAILIRDLNEVMDVKSVGELKRDYALSLTANSYSAVSRFLRYRELREEHKSDSMDVINTFLDKKIPKIKNFENDLKVADLCANSEKDDIISEQFAEILVSQQQYTRAKEIYLKLSLKNPEKSVYFAVRIEEIMRLKRQ